ncbi:MAG: hypothetical protein LWY06_20235 [Firmicutes bacterium]|nr:hypothetical protein [Bacillota bacterium]
MDNQVKKIIKKILVIVNKNWETDPVVNVFFNDKAIPKDYSVTVAKHPVVRKNPAVLLPRIRISNTAKNAGKNNDTLFLFEAEIWCIQDFMDPERNSSSSSEKVRVLYQLFEQYKKTNQTPDFLIAMGTAGYPEPDSYNGCVTIGTQVLINDAHPDNENKDSNWHHNRFGILVPSDLTKLANGFISQIPYSTRYNAECRFIPTPLNPVETPRIMAGDKYVALGNVNITDYSDFIWADKHAVEKARNKEKMDKIASVETTHGIIRMIAEDCLYHSTPPFLFISGITDRVGYFDEEVTPRVYTQNFVASHNMGITLAWLLQDLPGINLKK